MKKIIEFQGSSQSPDSTNSRTQTKNINLLHKTLLRINDSTNSRTQTKNINLLHKTLLRIN